MYIKLTQDAEKERQQRVTESRKRPAWQLFESKDRAEVFKVAREMGWKHDEVMVKIYGDVYMVEPFEICGCPNVVPFED